MEKEIQEFYEYGANLAGIYNSKGKSTHEKAHEMVQALDNADSRKFLNFVLTAHISVRAKAPTNFALFLQDDENLQPLGYSFINGFLCADPAENVKQD